MAALLALEEFTLPLPEFRGDSDFEFISNAGMLCTEKLVLLYYLFLFYLHFYCYWILFIYFRESTED